MRSDRLPAVLLLIAAAVGLIVANSPWGPAVIALSSTHAGVGPVDLSLTHWISDGLLAVFFFAVSVELRAELTDGELRSVRRALQPAIAAAGGVVVPVAIYLMIAAGSAVAVGWPVPTATDVAFALGVLAVFGRGLPPALRVFLLAIAILDDIVGIVLIAVLFADGLDFWMLAAAVVAVVAFALLSRVPRDRARLTVAVGLLALAVIAWVFVLLSGVHPTIAGVALGLASYPGRALRVRHALEPWINTVILPLFAFSAALVVIPAVDAEGVSPAFWGVLIALPVGKLVGIAGAGWIAQRAGAASGHPRFAVGDLVAVGALGGIGFTVSLLLADLAFAGDAVRDEAILGVLGGSTVALILSAAAVGWRARVHRSQQVAP